LNDYLICLRFTQGSTIKRKVQVGGSISGRVQSGGVSPRTVQLGGAAPNGKIPFPLMKRGRDSSDVGYKCLERENIGM
jgi:hypothetical protein